MFGYDTMLIIAEDQKEAQQICCDSYYGGLQGLSQKEIDDLVDHLRPIDDKLKIILHPTQIRGELPVGHEVDIDGSYHLTARQWCQIKYGYLGDL